ncbi:MAG: threonine synthase [Candidatus Pelagibacter sp.]
MNYVSTRDKSKVFKFKDVFLKGLADDGGLFVPEVEFKFNDEQLNSLKGLDYNQLAKEIISPFVDDFINDDDLTKIIGKSYSSFRKNNVIDLIKVEDRFILELFHGPTLAFKDVAMQLLGNFYEYYLEKNNEKINIVVATSGDTGAAAIEAIKGKKNLNIFVLHPHNRISSVQRKIMTTVKDNNVFNIAINGNFDDCQNLVKSMFEDRNFSKSINMSGVNSINWARIIAQSVYYFYSYFLIEDKTKPINFSVPTGNFGDVYAGYLAKKMGLPINKLVVATNQNDILHRAISEGKYVSEKVSETLSPSMDIQIASNFERLIYDLNNKDDQITGNIMKSIKKDGSYLIDKFTLKKINLDFLSASLNENEILKTISNVYSKNNLILDPHTAIGFAAFEKVKLDGNNIVLATAHPSKFPDAINKAIKMNAELPKELQYVLSEKENYDIVENNLESIKKHITERVK